MHLVVSLKSLNKMPYQLAISFALPAVWKVFAGLGVGLQIRLQPFTTLLQQATEIFNWP